MRAKIGSNPSFIWRSLLWGRELLDVGLCWRIGDGSSVDIFQDRWIPSLASYLDKNSIHLQEGTLVSSLICNRKWNEEMIRSVCLPYVAQKILSVPLANSNISNSRFWKFDKKGLYSVRGGYRVGIGMFEPPANNSSSFIVHNWWTCLWSLEIPPKIRIFWWRFFHNIIPTRANLSNHHVPVSRSCPFCNFFEESTCHAIFYCPAVKSLWNNNDVWKRLKKYNSCDTQVICFWLLDHISRKELMQFCYQAWKIWGERCWASHNNDNRELRKKNCSGLEFLLEYSKAKSTIYSTPSVSSSPAKWMVPPVNFLRLDIDASFPENSDICGVGGVIRNHMGQMVMAFGRTFPKPDSVVLGELLAMREGLKIAQDKDFRKLIISSDSLLAVQAVIKPSRDLSYVGLCALDVLALSLNLEIQSIFHVKRTANIVAHFLAKFACSSPAPFYWMPGNYPTWLVKLVMDDIDCCQ